MGKFEDLRARQIDDALAPFQELRKCPPPREGWVRTIREALGMSLRQLAERAGVSKTTVNSAEASESRGTVQLDSLERLADAMDCDVVYAVVPRGSLTATIAKQARRIAELRVTRVSESMELESQQIPVAERKHQVEEITADILRERGRDFWDVR
jgi:predicted DNA-binding mobile mystery protein A